jgi:hypothetical protein
MTKQTNVCRINNRKRGNGRIGIAWAFNVERKNYQKIHEGIQPGSTRGHLINSASTEKTEEDWNQNMFEARSEIWGQSYQL